MDAKVDGLVVTPRSGKPVEVQALWHNALRIVALYAANLGDAFTAARLLALADQARESFGALFWDEKSGYLADVVAPDGTRDLTLRPNQLFALSLHRPLLTGARAASVLRVVEERLLTPYGVRTLDPAHPDYRGRFEGGPAERDAAYHQGTAWPWLLGPFVDAHLAVRGNTPDSRRTAAAWLAPLVEHLFGAGLGQLPEVFDGDPPHRPGGCGGAGMERGRGAAGGAEDRGLTGPSSAVRRSPNARAPSASLTAGSAPSPPSRRRGRPRRVAIVVSPGNVVRSAPCAQPSFSASSGVSPERRP